MSIQILLFGLGIGDRHGVESGSFFVERVGFDDLLGLEVLEESKHEFADTQFGYSGSVFDATFSEHVGKGNGGRHLVSNDFENPAQDVELDHDIQSGILLIGNVEQFGVKGKDLVIFDEGDFPNRRRFEQMNDGGFLAVYGSRGVLAGQKSSDDAEAFSVIVVELFAGIVHGDVDLQAHEFFDGVDNVSELVFMRFSVASADFAGESAIDDSRRDIAVADVEFGNADGEDIAVKLVERLGDGKHFAFFGIELEGRIDAAKFFVILHFDKVNGCLAHGDVAEVVVAEIEENFGETVVGNAERPGRVDLNIFFALNELHKNSSLEIESDSWYND